MVLLNTVCVTHRYITEGKLKSDPMVLGALEYLAKHGDDELDIEAFEAAGGVGQEINPTQIREAVEEASASYHLRSWQMLREQPQRDRDTCLLGLPILFRFGLAFESAMLTIP